MLWYFLLCILVLLVNAELHIILEKANEELYWNSLGVLLPGNAEITPRWSDKDGQFNMLTHRFEMVKECAVSQCIIFKHHWIASTV